MSLRRTPGVICQCQSGTGIDGGTNALTLSGLPGPTNEFMGAQTAARTIYNSVAHQRPVCVEWDTIRSAGQLARTATACTLEFNLQLSLEQAVYGFAVRQVGSAYAGKYVSFGFLSERAGRLGTIPGLLAKPFALLKWANLYVNPHDEIIVVADPA